jgi:hypothetical protein
MANVITHANVLGGSDNPAFGTSRDEWNANHTVALDVVNADVNASAAIAESKLALSFATHSPADDPTADEKAALAGTGGAPASTNKYITEADTRVVSWPSADEKGAMAGTTGTPSDSNRFVTNSDTRLLNSIKAPVTIPVFLPTSGGPISWSNIPIAETEFVGNALRRFSIDLNQASSIGVSCLAATVAGVTSELRVQYTTDLSGASGWTTISGTAAALTATGIRSSGFGSIPAGAKPGGVVEVLIRVIGASTNGTDDLSFGSVYVRVK